MLEDDQVDSQRAQARPHRHRRVRHVARACRDMHPAAAAPGGMQVVLDPPGGQQRNLQLLGRGRHAQVSRTGQVRPAPPHGPRGGGRPPRRAPPRSSPRPARRAACRAYAPPAAPHGAAAATAACGQASHPVLGGIDELPELRDTIRSRRATVACSSPSCRCSAAITPSRAAYASHPGAAGGRSATTDHDQSWPTVIKPTRKADPGRSSASQPS